MDETRAHRASPVRVLVVDDDPDDRFLTREMLAEAGDFAVDVAGSADEAMECVQHSPPDLILSDYRLGPRTGLDLLVQARQHGFDVPVILLTGLRHPETHQAAREAGAATTIDKEALTAAVLREAIRSALGS